MKKVYMVRHGESEHNRRELIQGQIDSELTDRGRKQAEKLAEKLSGQEFDLIYSSDLKRARETAEIIKKRHGLQIIEDERLRERNLGELEGNHYTEWENIEKENHHSWRPENGESLKSHKKRVSELLEEIAGRELENVLIVTHGGSVRAAIMDIIDCESRQAWRFQVGNCSLTELSYTEQKGWFIRRVGRSAEE